MNRQIKVKKEKVSIIYKIRKFGIMYKPYSPEGITGFYKKGMEVNQVSDLTFGLGRFGLLRILFIKHYPAFGAYAKPEVKG